MKKMLSLRIPITGALFLGSLITGYGQQTNKLPSYTDRFKELRAEYYAPENGYFSKDGAPYHSIETLMCEAPDQGHESTSELYSYWVWLEAMHGKLTNDWAPLNKVWTKIEDQILPSVADQPTTSFYKASSPATYAPEHPLPSFYPAALTQQVSVGSDPVSPDLKAAYGDQVYGMHWLIDCDNFYGYGKRGDRTKTPSYINTFQRGEQESTWETVPHPSWEDFNAGGPYGFLPLFTLDQNYAKQWRYTNAPDADGRVVQAMYWAYKWAKENGKDPKAILPIDKTVKMGDFLRLAMFDKYFKPMGAQSVNAIGATGYESCHYLMSWYYAWGGNLPVEGQTWGWSWRIGCSHAHFGYQNPMLAYILSTEPDFAPKSTNGKRDWATSLDRQLDLYAYLQSPQGPIAGGVTNSWNGNYSPYPVGKSTFNKMAYVDHPVYRDPGSNTWPGFQGWSMQRVAEYYLVSNDPRAKKLLEKFIPWLYRNIVLSADGKFKVPADFEWDGEPDTWDPSKPSTNSKLKVTLKDRGTDLGVAASFARTLIAYAAAVRKHTGAMTPTADSARYTAQQVLDRMWTLYRDDKGIGAPEKRADYKRFFEQEVYIPSGFSGKMVNGDEIKPGIKFIDIRTGYKKDPSFDYLKKCYEKGDTFTITYHRGWAQIEIAIANAEYGIYFGNGNQAPSAEITSPANSANFKKGVIIPVKVNANDNDGKVVSVSLFADNILVGTDATAPYEFSFSPTVEKEYMLKAVATDDSAATGTSAIVTISVGNAAPIAVATATPIKGNKPLLVNFDASGSTDLNGDVLTYTWDFGDGTTGTGAKVSHTYTAQKVYVATVTVSDGSLSSKVNITITVDDKPSCNFGAPLATSLPSTSYLSLNKVLVIGNGPKFDNVTNFTMNWDLQNNGLWQFSVQTNNGKPDWYNDLRGKMTYSFNVPQPRFTIKNSGFEGFDGEYFVTRNGNDFVMVAGNGTHVIYCTNSATTPDCALGIKSAKDFTAGKAEAVVNVFPNPFENNFYITCKEYASIKKIEVFNSLGFKVYEKVGSDIQSPIIQLAFNKSESVYIVKVTTANSVITKTVIKK